MINAGIIIALTLLCAANLLLLSAIVFSGRNIKNKATRTGFGFMAIVLVLDTFFALGGVVLW